MVNEENKLSEVGARLSAYADFLQVSIAKFESDARLANGFVSNTNANMREGSKDKLRKYYPNLNLDWVLAGEGDMLISESASDRDNQKEAHSESKVIRYWESMEATGGGVESFDDIKSGYVSLVLPDFHDCTDAVNIVGESMEPTYKSGSIILLKEWTEKFIEYGNPYLVVTRNGNRMVKILRKVEDDPALVRCESVNPAYDPFEVEKAEILRLYIVKGVISKVVM